MCLVRIWDNQFVNLVQTADRRGNMDRCAPGNIFHLAAACLCKRNRAIFQNNQIMTIFAPGFDMTFSHCLTGLHKFGEWQSRCLGYHQKVVQCHRHPVWDITSSKTVSTRSIEFVVVSIVTFAS